MIQGNEIIDILNKYPTNYHMVSMFREKLLGLGYTELNEDLNWPINHSKFFIIYKNKSIFAFDYKDNSKGILFAENIKSNIFHIEKKSKFPTLDYNFCRISLPFSKSKNWAGIPMRLAGHISIKNESEEVQEENIFPKPLAAVFPSKSEIELHCKSTKTDNIQGNDTFTYDFFIGLSRDCNVFINEYPGPLIKLISDELNVSPNNIQDPDLYFIDSTPACIVGNKIISGSSISQFCPSFLAFNSFVKSVQLNKEKGFSSFILIDENESLDDFILNLFEKIGFKNNSLFVNVASIQNDAIENKFFFDTNSDAFENIFSNEPNIKNSKIQIGLDKNLTQIAKLASNDVVKLGLPVSNIDSPRERTAMICFNTLDKLLNDVILNSK